MSATDRQSRRWTSAEDQTLREHVDAQQAQGGGKDWCQIALALPGRTNKDCRKRWHNSLAEGLRKGQWSKSEDQLLTHGVHRYGSQWTKVATCVSSRSADQCAKRWQQSLDPRLDHSEWRENEDMALLAAVDRLGRHWKDIQEQYLPHRSKNCVKNRYSVLARRTATQLVPLDDNLGSSSSDPGTPLQMEADLPIGLMSMPRTHNTTQIAYMQVQMPNTSNNDMSWAWSGLGDPSVSMPVSYYDPFDTSSRPTHYNIHQGPILSSPQSQWDAMQTTMGSQYPMHYRPTLDPLMHGYTYPTHHQPHLSSTIPQTTTGTHSPGTNAPSARSPSSHTYRGGCGQKYRDSASFG